MSRMTDAIITYAILRKFTTPVKETDAYKMGLVDAEGMPTEKSKHDTSEKALDALTLLDRLVFKLKRLFKKMPPAMKLIGGYAVALAFIKEDTGTDDDFAVFENLEPARADFWHKVLIGEETVGFDSHNIIKIAEDPRALAQLVEAYQSGNPDAIFEDGVAPAAPGNVSAQVQGMETEPVITKEKQKKWVSQNSYGNVGRKIEEIL